MRPTIAVTVRSVHLPTITWRCPTCHRPETFTCSERFRANANGKLVDIWLIYRCRRCDATKNVTVVERTPVRRVPPDLLRAAQDNDAATARRLARDVDLLRRAGVAVAEGDRWTLDSPPQAIGADAATLHLELPEPLLVRLDAVVAAASGLPRRAVHERLVPAPGAPRADALRRWGSAEVVLRHVGQRHVPV